MFKKELFQNVKIYLVSDFGLKLYCCTKSYLNFSLLLYKVIALSNCNRAGKEISYGEQYNKKDPWQCTKLLQKIKQKY